MGFQCAAVVTTAVVAVFVALTLPKGLETRVWTAEERERVGGEHSSYVSLPDGVTHVEMFEPEGEAKGVVVLVHGGISPGTIFGCQVRAITSDGFRTVIYDRFGMGRSDRPDVVYDMDLYQRQLVGVIDAISPSEPVHLLGYSFGGPIAGTFAADHPSRVASLTFIAPVVEYKANLLTLKLATVPVLGPYLVSGVFVDRLRRRNADGIKNVPTKYHEEIKHSIVRFNEQMNYVGYQRALISMVKNSLLEDYTSMYERLGKAFNGPSLLVWGSSDGEIFRESFDAVKGALPSVQAIEKPGRTHSLPLEDPDMFNSLLLSFLNRE